MKKEKIMQVVAWSLAVGLAAAGITGCGREEEPPIIGETNMTLDEELEEERQNANSDSDNQGVPQNSLKEMLALPARYTSIMEMDGMCLTADAPIQVPEVESIKIKTLKSADFSQKTFETVREALGKEYQVTWVPWVGESNIDGILEQSEGGEIHLTYHTRSGDDGADKTSFIWATSTPKARAYQEEPKGEWEGVNYYEKSALQVADRLEQAETLELKGEKLVEACGLVNYELRNSWWVQNLFSGGDSSWGYSMRLTPSEDGIGLVSQMSKLGEAKIDGPYLDIFYTESGILSSFQLVETYQVSEGQSEKKTGKQKEELFLLPFQTIAELFEQYVRDTEEEQPEAWNAYWADSFLAQSVIDSTIGSSLQSGRPAEKRQMRITRVALEYGLLAEDGEENSNEKQLIPVWSFYGCQGDDSVEELILSIRADDGQPLKS